MAIKTIFLDRDGVINQDFGYVHKIENFEFIDGIFDSCRFFQKLNYQIIIITNQSGIARGYFTEKDHQALNKWMVDQFNLKGISILDTFYCPHGPKSQCNCRKPQPGMFLNAQIKYNIDMQNSWMIGDSERDIIAANSAGITNTILLSAKDGLEINKSNAKFKINSIKDSQEIILE